MPAPQFGHDAQERIRFEVKGFSGAFTEFLLSEADHGQAAAGARMKKRFSKEFSIGRVDQRV